jgi:hypothetical protein
LFRAAAFPAMTPAPRILLCLLLVWLQVLSPWVHAHTGAETGGGLHMPGLERLGLPAPGCAAGAARPDASGLLVAVPSGALTALGSLRPATGLVVAPPPPAPRAAVLAAVIGPERPAERGLPPGRDAPGHPDDSPPRAPPEAPGLP